MLIIMPLHSTVKFNDGKISLLLQRQNDNEFCLLENSHEDLLAIKSPEIDYNLFHVTCFGNFTLGFNILFVAAFGK